MNKDEAKSKAKNIYEEVQGGVNEVISKIREMIKEGSARRLIIKNKEGKIVFQTQLAMGVGGAALIGAMAPVISAIGMFAMFINDVTILVEKDPDFESEEDEYSVDAEVIDIEDEEEEETEEKSKKAEDAAASEEDEEEEPEEKTVGRKKKKKDE